MRLIARKGRFVCALVTVILSGSLFTRVVFADDEPKTVPARDEHPKKLGTAIDLVSVRPEARYEYAYAFSARPWDNSTRKGQLMFAMDALLRL